MDAISHRRTGGAASASIMSMKMAAHAHAKAASQKTQKKRAEAAATATATSRPKPRRPPSAYSLFFKQERKKLLGKKGASDDSANGLLDRIIANGGGLASGSNGNASSDDEGLNSGKKRPPAAAGAISSKAAAMNELAKAVSRKWKALDESSRSVFEALALLERKKYERETEIWNRERRVEEERLSGKLGIGGGAKTFKKEMSAEGAATTKRKREEASASAEKKSKKPKVSSTVSADPLKSKQILPHMLGHGRRRFGVPKHVMDKAFSKSRGQSRSSSSSKRQQQTNKADAVPSLSPSRFGVPAKALGRAQQRTRVSQEKEPAAKSLQEEKPGFSLAVPRSVSQREQLRAARMKALAKQPPKPREFVLKAENAQPEKNGEARQPTLNPSTSAVLGTATSNDQDAPTHPQPLANAPEQAQADEPAINSFESAFNETMLLATASSLQPISQVVPTQPRPQPESTTMDAIASAMELVRPLSGSGEAPAASALHAHAASASRALRMAEDSFCFSCVESDADDNSKLLFPKSMHRPPVLDAFPSCDMLMLQRTIENTPSSLGQDKTTPRGQEEKTSSPTTIMSEGGFSWADDDLVEPTPLGSLAPSPGDEVENELNMSIANIFGVTTLGDDTQQAQEKDFHASSEDISGTFKASEVNPFPQASSQSDLSTDTAQAAVAVEPDCIAQLQLRAQAALSSGSRILSPTTPTVPPINQDIGDDDSPLDGNSIEFLMSVFH